MATCADGIRAGECLMRGAICSRILEAFVLEIPIDADQSDGGIKEGLTFAL